MKRGPIVAGLVVATIAGSASSARGGEERITPERDRLGWAVPDYARVQTGGFLGMVTLGVGYSAFRDVLNVGASYGYVPPLDGAPQTHLVTATLTVRPLRLSFGAGDRFYYYPVYIGGGGLLASNPNLFIQQPKAYPEGYYAPNALHAVAVLGMELAVRTNEGSFLLRHGVFVEFVTINQYLDALNQNRDIALYNAFSTAAGYRAAF